MPDQGVDAAAFEVMIDRLMDGAYLSLPEGDSPLADKLRALADRLESRSKMLLVKSVDMSIFLNGTVTQAVQTLRSIREMSRRMASISSATEEMVSTVQAISRTSELAAANADSVRELSIDGARSTEAVVSTMRTIVDTVEQTADHVGHLSEASSSIGAIVKQIEQIARQTNILALNATIEAARAGETGRGFAVVADSVRQLAEESNASAHDINTILSTIRGSVDEVSSDVQIASGKAQGSAAQSRVVEGALQKIRQCSEQVAAAVSDIANAAQEQSTAGREIAKEVETVANLSESTREQVGKVDALATDLSKNVQKLSA